MYTGQIETRANSSGFPEAIISKLELRISDDLFGCIWVIWAILERLQGGLKVI